MHLQLDPFSQIFLIPRLGKTDLLAFGRLSSMNGVPLLPGHPGRPRDFGSFVPLGNTNPVVADMANISKRNLDHWSGRPQRQRQRLLFIARINRSHNNSYADALALRAEHCVGVPDVAGVARAARTRLDTFDALFRVEGSVFAADQRFAARSGTKRGLSRAARVVRLQLETAALQVCAVSLFIV